MAIKRPMHGIRQPQKWPMCGNCSGPQQAHMWQSTGTEMAIKRRTHGSEQAHKWPICGSCPSIQKAQMWQSPVTYMAVDRHVHTWQSTGTYIAIDRHTCGSQNAHTQQSHARPYVAVVLAYKLYRGGNTNEHKLVAQKTRRDKDNYFNILLIRQC